MEFVVIDATLLSCSRGEMVNMQPSLSVPSFAGASPPSPSQLAVGSGGPMMGQASKDKTMASAEQLVLDLCDPELRENALLELSKVSTHNSFSPSS
jgi:CCR4-NOT transcription complex subunit 9